MNSNGFTKRNVFIGDVSISEDLICGDMVCEEMTLTGNVNLDNKDIVGVNNLQTITINNGAPMTNPASIDLDMGSNNIVNNPQIDNLETKTQYIAVNLFSETEFSTAITLLGNAISNTSSLTFANGSSIDGSETNLSIAVPGGGKIVTDNTIETSSELRCDSLTATTSIDSPEITSLENKTQYLSATANVSTFSGTISIGGVYQFPSTGPTVANQYLVFSSIGTGSFTSQPNPSYVRISRTNSVTGAIALTGATFYTATALGAGLFVTDHEKTLDMTTNLTTGVITYTGPSKIMTLSGSIRVSVSAGGINNTFSYYLTNPNVNPPIIIRDSVYLKNTDTRFQLNLSYTQLVTTNFSLSFGVQPDANGTFTFSSLQLAMNP
jgi:hypothetical protein